MAELHRIIGRAGKCGPSAISAIAGVPTHEAAAVLRDLTGRRAINGTSGLEMVYGLEWFGVRLRGGFFTRYRRDYHDLFPGMYECLPITLTAFDKSKPDGRWLLSVTDHWIVYGNGAVADSGAMFSRKPAPLASYRNGGRSQIRLAYQF